MIWDDYFIEFALCAAKRSTCIRKQVGAVIVKDNRIIATGYNGVPSKAEHCIEYFRKKYDLEHKKQYDCFENYLKSHEFYHEHGDFSRKFELHAEANAFAFSFCSLKDCTLYVTLSPCCSCSKLILAYGISRVVYLELYDRDIDGLEVLKNYNIEVCKIGSL